MFRYPQTKKIIFLNLFLFSFARNSKNDSFSHTWIWIRKMEELNLEISRYYCCYLVIIIFVCFDMRIVYKKISCSNIFNLGFDTWNCNCGNAWSTKIYVVMLIFTWFSTKKKKRKSLGDPLFAFLVNTIQWKQKKKTQ